MIGQSLNFYCETQNGFRLLHSEIGNDQSTSQKTITQEIGFRLLHSEIGNDPGRQHDEQQHDEQVFVSFTRR